MRSPGDIGVDSSSSRGGLRAGKYELLTRIAAGGMGEVFIARAVGTGAFEKRVALKLLLPHLTGEAEFVHMFLDEARIAARMNHPNIVQIFDLGEADGRYYLAMALVEGLSLSRLLKACRQKQKPVPLPLVRLIAVSLCEGLAYAHELKGPRGEAYGVVHRDVNPHNLLISSAGQVLLTDFGIAKAQGNLHRTRPGDVRGKYAYMAPEQMRSGAAVDSRADLFSAAVTLYETVTLVQPFIRRTDPETMDAVRFDGFDPARKLRPEVSEKMSAALQRGMARRVDERFTTARELREAFLDGPVAAPHELGEWLRELCGAELGVFDGKPEPMGKGNLPAELTQSKVTGSLPSTTKATAARTPAKGAQAAGARTNSIAKAGGVRRASPRRLPWPMWVATGLATLGVASLVVLFWPVPAPVEAPAAPQDPAAASPLVLPGVADPEPSSPVLPEPEDVDESGGLPPLPARGGEPALRGDRRANARSPGRRTAKEKVAKATSPSEGSALPSHAPPVPTVAVGYLTVDARPWAELYVDGQRVDRTPLSRYPLRLGEHQLRFTNPELRQEIRRTVTIQEGKTETVRVDFQP